MSSMLLRNSY